MLARFLADLHAQEVGEEGLGLVLVGGAAPLVHVITLLGALPGLAVRVQQLDGYAPTLTTLNFKNYLGYLIFKILIDM